MKTKTDCWDELRLRLGRAYSHHFYEADDRMVSGKGRPQAVGTSEVGDAGECCGDKIKVGFVAHDAPQPPRSLLTVGRVRREGSIEPCGMGELRCYRSGPALCVGHFEGGKLCSAELRCITADPEADDGWFTWFGPATAVCTPWSDNDPDQVQFITVNRLRRYGEGRSKAAGVPAPPPTTAPRRRGA